MDTIRTPWYASLTHEEADQRFLMIERQYWDAVDAVAALATERASILNLYQENDWPKPEDSDE